ncbi:MAG: Ig-like domain-containing protein [Tannerellaceae bacterium]|jgi:uncharacterized protein YjdB|nr:Ig-like domain-containing protein [Tannerellaceae bacterium]
MKKFFLLFILFFLFFSTGSIIAETRTVTTNADDGEGSFRAILAQMQDGDILVFSPDLEPITIESTILYISDNNTGFTIQGNGVTIIGKPEITLSFGRQNQNQRNLTTLVLENINFKNFETVYLVAVNMSAKNVTFVAEDDEICAVHLYARSNQTLSYNTFEGCSFIGEGSGTMGVTYSARTNSYGSDIQFISCTFKNGNNIAETSGTLIYPGSYTDKINSTLTNCVLIDNNYTNTVPSINSQNFTSKGYNVIMGSVNGEWTDSPAWKQGSDVILKGVGDDADASPLMLDEGIYKVVAGGPADKHLPANTTIEGVTFPQKDLLENTIDYTKATHSGAYQVVYGEDTGGSNHPTAINLGGAMDGQEFFSEATLQLSASVSPNGIDQSVTWISSNEEIASIDNTGLVTLLPTTATENKEVTFTATTIAEDASGNPLEASVTIVVKPYVHVTEIRLKTNTYKSLINIPILLSRVNGNPDKSSEVEAVVLPENANSRTFTWSINNDEVATLGTFNAAYWSLTGKKPGTVTLTATSEDGNVTATCEFTFHAAYNDENKGVFMLTEGAYPGGGILHYLYKDGLWDYDVYGAINNSSLGITTQYGTIYGDKFYFVSKQGPRLVVADAVTVKEHKSFNSFGKVQTNDIDGRAFLGVDEKIGYVGTSHGICVVDLEALLEGDEKTVADLPYTTIEGTGSDGGLYSGQVGTMIRVGDRVFAVQQNKGLLVIDALTHTLERTLTGYNFATLAQSLDGYLWSGTSKSASTGEYEEESGNVLLRIDPWTLETKEIILPSGINGPSVAWGAWQADPFVGSMQENKLYWKNDPQKIYQYDIATNTIETVFNCSNEEIPEEHQIDNYEEKWSMYGTSFRLDPITDDIYVWISLFNTHAPNSQRAVWKAQKINHKTNEIIDYPMRSGYWFPSLWIFQDNYAPVISDNFTDVNVSEETRIYLGDLVTDVDNMDAGIIKSILPGYDEELISARVWRDSLYITPIKALAEEESTTLTLKANSNGQVVTKSITVTVGAGATAAIPVTGVTLNHTTAGLKVGETLQLTATVAPNNADNKAVTWTSNNPAIASVSSEGLITAHAAPGTAVITVTTADGSHTARCTVTTLQTGGTEINPFELTQKALSLFPNQTVTLALTAPQHFNVTWSSSNSSVATVSRTGEVRSVAAGTAYIIARDVEQGKSDICVVTVTNLPTTPESITLNTSLLSLMEGETTTLTTTLSSGLTGKTITWSSSDKAVADVTSGGLVIAVAPGTCIIKASIGTYEATCIIVVSAYSGDASVTGITQNEAFVVVPVYPGASYYLIHLYKKIGNTLEPHYTLKVTPDGHVTMLRSAGTTLSVQLNYLESGTSYVADIETVKETNGKAEIIRTKTVGFTTLGTPTGIKDVTSSDAKVWYSNGTLHLENLNGHSAHLFRLSGQGVAVIKVNSDYETYRGSLPAGIYILTAEKGGSRKTFKIVVL